MVIPDITEMPHPDPLLYGPWYQDQTHEQKKELPLEFSHTFILTKPPNLVSGILG
jgi:hypothetical protein